MSDLFKVSDVSNILGTWEILASRKRRSLKKNKIKRKVWCLEIYDWTN